MSYISALKIKDKVLVWEKDSNNNRVVKSYPTPYYFYIEADEGEYTSIDGKQLTRFDFDNFSSFRDGKDECIKRGYSLYESDIAADHKILSEHYYGKQSPQLNIMFYDIEVDYKTKSYDNSHKIRAKLNNKDNKDNKETSIDVGALRNSVRNQDDIIKDLLVLDETDNTWVTPSKSPYIYEGKTGFSSTSDPYAPINAVAMFHEHLNKMVVVAVPPEIPKCEIPALGVAGEDYRKKMNDITPIISDIEIEIVFVATERELLLRLLDEMDDADVICGWNNKGFDDPYVGKRIEMVLGVGHFRRMSFKEANTPQWDVATMFGKEQPIIQLSGRVSLDYLDLFKKYMVENQPSYKLDAIADKFLRTDGKPDMPKLEYQGSLANLYTHNFDYFIRYNIRDTEILHGFEQKLKYVALANEMVHSSTGQFNNVVGTIKLSELAVINYCHHELNNIIVNDRIEGNWSEGKIQGAIVLDPVMGIHDWLSSIDLNSLYPSAIRACNISPETKIGQFAENEDAFLKIAKQTQDSLLLNFVDGKPPDTKTAKEWNTYLKEHNMCISGFGTVFTLDKKGIMPSILEDWYATRKKHQKSMLNYKEQAKAILEKYK